MWYAVVRVDAAAGVEEEQAAQNRFHPQRQAQLRQGGAVFLQGRHPPAGPHHQGGNQPAHRPRPPRPPQEALERQRLRPQEHGEGGNARAETPQGTALLPRSNLASPTTPYLRQSTPKSTPALIRETTTRTGMSATSSITGKSEPTCTRRNIQVS